MCSFNLNGALCSRVMVQCEVGACKLGNREKTDEEPVKKGSKWEYWQKRRGKSCSSKRYVEYMCNYKEREKRQQKSKRLGKSLRKGGHENLQRERLSNGKFDSSLWEEKGRWGHIEQQPDLRQSYSGSNGEDRYLHGLKCPACIADFLMCIWSLLQEQKTKKIPSWMINRKKLTLCKSKNILLVLFPSVKYFRGCFLKKLQLELHERD